MCILGDNKGAILPPTPPQRLYGIIGHPLGHTMSPALHTWAFQEIGEPGAYMLWDVLPGDLPRFMDAVRVLPISGCSVTIPHKEAVIPFLDGISPNAGRVGAVNTLYWRDGKLLGENTDLIGFLAPLRNREISSAMVLGAGGAARAVIAGLLDKGVPRVYLANRSLVRAEKLSREFSIEPLEWDDRGDVQCELLINTTPLGMLGPKQGDTPWPRECFRKGQIAYDLVYNPQRTRFLREAGVANCEIIDGLSMFIAQAMEQSRLWTGSSFSAQEGRELLTALF